MVRRSGSWGSFACLLLALACGGGESTPTAAQGEGAGPGASAALIQGSKMVLDPDGGARTRDLAERGVWQPRETKLIAEHVQPGQFVIDVGADDGYYALLASSRVGDKGRVVAIECEPDAFARLQANAELNARATLSVVNACPAPLEYEALSLDELAKDRDHRVDLVKLDGAWLSCELLDGMEQILVRNPDLSLLVEYHPQKLRSAGHEPVQCLERLQSLGFSFREIVHGDKPRMTPVPLEEIVARFPANGGTHTTLFLLRRHSQGPEELILREIFGDKRGGVFVDVGSADYSYFSTTYYLDSRREWTGIAIDALAQYAAGYAKHRPRTKFLTRLVSDKASGDQAFFRSKLVPELSSADKDKATKQAVQYTGRADVSEVKVPTATLNGLLAEHGITKVDFLSMDIEGHELKALAGFDIEKHKPDLVCIEAHPENRDGLMQYFSAHGYERLDRYLSRDEVNWYFAPKGAP